MNEYFASLMTILALSQCDAVYMIAIENEENQ